MLLACVHLLILMTPGCLSGGADETKVALSCSEHQKAFRGSCFEFVDLPLTFSDAQNWCEQRDGHLAFIPDQETQSFLQRHLDPEKDVWFGAASNLKHSPADEGPLSWLDGSLVTYSRWAHRSEPRGAACGHILRDSGFQWQVTRDCDKVLPFVCQFESGRSIICAGRDSTLQCSSGQVLIIDGGFYGRKSLHYCRSAHTAPTQPECGWTDMVASLTARCQGRQLCRINGSVASGSDPCPLLGSYLSLDYHCTDGVQLSAPATASVFDAVTISVKWLLRSSLGNFQCKLSSGDGHVINLQQPEELERGVVHTYSHPGIFVVALECTSSHTQITAQKVVTIQEAVGPFGAITCYAGKLSFHASNCKSLYGETFQIQMEVKAGTNVTYRLWSEGMLLSSSTAARGNIPHNISVTANILRQLGPGCHQLSLLASNAVSSPGVTTDLHMCVLEKVAGLQASVLQVDTVNSPDITVGVSLQRGAPVLLLFLLAEGNHSFSEIREMNTSAGIFHLRHRMQGSVAVKLRAWNEFSSSEVDVNPFAPDARHSRNSVVKARRKHTRVARSPLRLSTDPASGVVEDKTQGIQLLSDSDECDRSNRRCEWSCTHPCKCQTTIQGLTYAVPGNCVPDPFHYNKYHFRVKDNNNKLKKSADICISLIPEEMDASTSLTCTEGCDPITVNLNAKLVMSCGDESCPTVAWYKEDQRPKNLWEAETKSCYEEANRKPLQKIKDGGTEHYVSYYDLISARTQNRDIVITITTTGNEPRYKSYTVRTSTQGSASTTSGSTSTEATPGPTSSSSIGTSAMSAATSGTSAATSGSSAATSGSSAATSGSSAATSGSSAATSGSSAATSATSAATSGSSAATSAASATSSPATTNMPEDISCIISPTSGTIISAFKITCSTARPCVKCKYCMETQEDKHLRCSRRSEVKSVFLPLGDSSSNYSLIVKVTAKNSSYAVSTTVTAQVLDTTDDSNSLVDALKTAVVNAGAQLTTAGDLSGEALGQILLSVSKKLNDQSDALEKEARKQLRKQMLDQMISAVTEVPASSAKEVQVIARSLNSVIQVGSELSTEAQVEAAEFFGELSSSLLNMATENNEVEVSSAASTIVEGASYILDYPSNKNTSDAVLLALTNTQSALLTFQEIGKGPTVIIQSNIAMAVERVTPDSLNSKEIKLCNYSSPTFSLPVLPSDLLVPDEPVDVRMLSLDKNPFSWNERGNISGQIGALSLTTKDGSAITVENLSEDVEILLPRPIGEQVNTSILDLGNFSTTIIDLPSNDTTLVLKVVPSYDPLPLKLFLGYMEYPTDTNYIAMTEMPHPGVTQEEKYTWILEPKSLKGNTGAHYLVVRPIVGPGIKSINATLAVTPITTSCKFWNESILDWSDLGCRVGFETTDVFTQCLCSHLTFFGSSFFVTPNLVDPSRTTELFATFAENPVVVCFVAALFGAYLLALVWARRKDVQDVAKVKVTMLEDNNPMDEYLYLLSVCTGHRRGASTSSQVTITLLGLEGNSEPHHLTDPKKCVFERGAVDVFLLTAPFSLGDLQGIRLWHNNSGSYPAWYVGNVVVQDLQTEQKWHFLCNSWLAIDLGDCCLDQVFPVSSEADLKRFSNLFFMKTSKDFSDGHLWYSVISRPPSSTFTCVQRVSCCFSLLLCTMLTSIMFYGVPADPSEQTMDLGAFEFTWQQFMIGVQSSLIMFPVNILIVSIFRNTRPRETSCCKRRAEKPRVLQPAQTVPNNSNVTLEAVIKEIQRIISALSNSSTPGTKLEPGQHHDINAVLSVMDDLIKLNNTSDTGESKVQTQEIGANVPPGSTVDGPERKSSKAQYLHRQLCHIDKGVTLLGPSAFPSPHSYSQAVKQVQGMKSYLEDQIFTLDCVNQDQPTEKKLSPAEDGGGAQKKKSGCCQGGLPWWFVFLGWLLVVATSVVAGYFTMLYGLKFGKPRSVSWLISMVVSFFQSILIIQPLKVLCLAVFFALVIKRVDEDDHQSMEIEGNHIKRGESETVRHNNSLYEPPPAADIERMKRNKILEQKAFALFREILAYMGFMWMLLLVAYGQRDPNAFHLNQHIRSSFIRNSSPGMSLGDVFIWARTSLLSNLFGEYPGFITDGNSKLVGSARLRQLRVKRSSCQIAGAMRRFVPDCQAPYSWDVEDTGSYGLGWNRSDTSNVSTSFPSPWKYQTQTQLRAYPVWGKISLYRGGGFVAELGPDLQNASRTLEHLFRNKWLDLYTRAVIVEFTVYNANVNLFCIVTLLLENTAAGAFRLSPELQSIRLYTSPGGLHVFVMAAEIAYMLFVLYYMFMQAKLMKQQRWSYLRSKWNLLDLSIILLSWGAVAVFTKRTLLGNRDIDHYQNHKDQFPNFRETATADSTLQYLIAFLVLLSTVKLWHLLRLNPKMNMITATLRRAWSDISGFLLIISITFAGYSVASNVIYGWELSAYKTVADALVTIIRLQIGIFNYDEVLNNNPVLGGLLFGSCIVFLTFVVLNLLISVILVAFNQEQIYHKPSDEEEIVDLMLKKICSLFGIRYKNPTDAAEPDGRDGGDPTPNNSRNIPNNSSTDVIFLTSDSSAAP